MDMVSLQKDSSDFVINACKIFLSAAKLSSKFSLEWKWANILSKSCIFCDLIFKASGSNWNQSHEAVNTDTSGRGKTVFSLGLGITGPDMLAAARGGRYTVLWTHPVITDPFMHQVIGENVH